MPVLEGLQGLAMLMVLLLHFVGNTAAYHSIERAIVGVTSYGSYGVELFFVLSGARNEPQAEQLRIAFDSCIRS
jgi:peptidoglycan/LPS O-acetylase OafA/YrhL